ncbi:MAG: 37S ribosomal protein S23 mitochondrial [Caeruleum heppii]|nr:MAG: 37S ribosomal protein S23 mitochondrial [Caeruleum heppii]
MASIRCWTCLHRLRPPRSTSHTPHLPSTHPFSTSTSSLAKQTKIISKKPREQSVRVRNAAPARASRPPARGERKAIRKRIVLSNTNALEVPALKELSAEQVRDDGLEGFQGEMMGFPGELVDKLRTVGIFQPRQRWGVFRRPATLVRRETVEVGKYVKELSESEGEDQAAGKTMRRIYTGERGTGKSVMLLQAMAMAFVNNWIVISIPEAEALTRAHTEYAPLSTPTANSPTTYIQRTYCASLLSQISSANKPILSQLTLSQKHSLPIPLQPNISLDRLADLGARDPEISWPVFQALWTELTAPNPTPETKRPPLMITIDCLAHLMRPSAYRAADYSIIHAHDLIIPSHFISLLSGATPLGPSGGAILAATSGSSPPSAPTFTLRLAQLEGLASGLSEPQIPQPGPFEKIDPRVSEAMTDVEVKRLEGLDTQETRALMEYFARSGVLRRRVDEETVRAGWIVGGRGVVGEVERAVLGVRG